MPQKDTVTLIDNRTGKQIELDFTQAYDGSYDNRCAHSLQRIGLFYF